MSTGYFSVVNFLEVWLAHSNSPLTHSVPQAINTPVLPLRISPCPPTRFKPPSTDPTSVSDCPLFASASSSAGMVIPLEMMSLEPFWMIVRF